MEWHEDKEDFVSEDEWEITEFDECEEILDSDFEIINLEDIQETESNNVKLSLNDEVKQEENLEDIDIDNTERGFDDLNVDKKENNEVILLNFQDNHFVEEIEDEREKDEKIEDITESENTNDDYIFRFFIDSEVAKKQILDEKLIASDRFWEKYEYWDSNPGALKGVRKNKYIKHLRMRYMKGHWDPKNSFLYV
ncbi:UNVERIFIED_CONTAM: hypothetical protein RMT77_004148 [Armadillidium vulgare]